MQSDLPEIKLALQDRIVEVCARMLPNGRREGTLWVSSNPKIAGDEKKTPALKVGLSRDKGAWRDWRSGDKGDVIALIGHCMGTDTRGAMQWARDFLGIRTMTREERAQLRQEAELRNEAEAKRLEKARAFKLMKADELFRQGFALGEGSAAEAHALAYFRGRRCAIEEIATLNRFTFRFSGATEWWKGARWRNDGGQRYKEAAGQSFPAVHSALRQATGIVTCCHCTFLDPLKPRKAPVDPPKLMFGEALGGVIEIATGIDAGPFWGPNDGARPVIICEGIETGLSIAAAIPDVRVWAAGSLAGIGSAPVQLSCVSDVTVARDNNAGNRQAQQQLDRGLEKLAAHGKPLVVMASHVGDDFNDLAQEGETP